MAEALEPGQRRGACTFAPGAKHSGTNMGDMDDRCVSYNACHTLGDFADRQVATQDRS